MKQYNNDIMLIDRIISAATYCTSGGVGFIWLILNMILRKAISPFLMYHILQSIFISILYFVIVKLCELTLVIPILNKLSFFIGYRLNAPLALIYNLSPVQICTYTFIFYLAATSFIGLYSYIPWVSNIINQNTGNR